jgi:hypothetical protein
MLNPGLSAQVKLEEQEIAALAGSDYITTQQVESPHPAVPLPPSLSSNTFLVASGKNFEAGSHASCRCRAWREHCETFQVLFS